MKEDSTNNSLVKQQQQDSINLKSLKNKTENTFNNKTNEKNLDLLQSLTQSSNLTSNLSSSFKKTTTAKNKNFKEDNLFNHRQLQDNDNQQQMSPSSSSTSAYVSLYASSSFSSTGSSNYSTSGFSNENCSSNSSDSSKKISRSAILDTLMNRKQNNNKSDKSSLIKKSDKIDKEKQTSKEAKDNKIVIDVSMNGNNSNYDSLNQSIQNEHIYEELECSFEREINIIDNLNNNLNTVKKSIFEGASKDQILEYLIDAKESK